MINKVYDYIFDDNPLKALEIVKSIDTDEARELQKKLEHKLRHVLYPEKYIEKYRDDPMNWRPEYNWNDRYEWVWNNIKSHNAKSFIDLGCYEGSLVLKAGSKGIESVGVELCSAACHFNTSRIAENTNCKFINEQIEEYKDTRKYDIVSCMEVIEHVADPQKLISVIKSLMHEDSIALITTPRGCYDLQNTIKIWNEPDTVFDHVRSYEPNTLKDEINTKNVSIYTKGKELYASFKL